MYSKNKRGERRDRTERWAKRGLKFWLSFGYKARPLGEFAKRKALSCRCRRVCRTGSPKIAGGLCHVENSCWHPCVRERIEGKRLTRGWLHELRGRDPLDVEL